jgi:hypothetical protein
MFQVEVIVDESGIVEALQDPHQLLIERIGIGDEEVRKPVRVRLNEKR